jgi:hypothetical protein
MANLTTTEIDIGQLELGECEHEDGTVNFSGADTLVRGTILARHTGNLKLQIYVKGGSSNGDGVPECVLAHDLVATGSGDLPCRVIIKGTVNKRRLVIDAQGDDSAIDATVRDLLRDHGITPVIVDQVGGALFTDEDS